MRLHRLQNRSNYLDFLAENLSGKFVLTDVSFDQGDLETIRLNVSAPNSSLRRAHLSSQTFPRSAPPFEIRPTSLLLSFEQIANWQDNFAIVREAIGDARLGTVPANDPKLETILPKLQSLSSELARIDTFLETLLVETDLYLWYLERQKRIDLYYANNLTQAGERLLSGFQSAVSKYTQIPELRKYFEQSNVREGDLGPRGQQFRAWFALIRVLRWEQEFVLEYMEYELRPHRLCGNDFKWREVPPLDMRKLSVDLLCRFEGEPTWCELKMCGDAWTSSAVLQILFYGSMLSGPYQEDRCGRQFPNRFRRMRPWLGVIVERRDEPGFKEDFDNAVAFARHERTRQCLEKHIAGMIFVMIDPQNGGWGIQRQPELIRW